jgi:hypothetical protein
MNKQPNYPGLFYNSNRAYSSLMEKSTWKLHLKTNSPYVDSSRWGAILAYFFGISEKKAAKKGHKFPASTKKRANLAPFLYIVVLIGAILEISDPFWPPILDLRQYAALTWHFSALTWHHVKVRKKRNHGNQCYKIILWRFSPEAIPTL